MLNGKRGFTLIELVIVIAVIAIVIGAALPRLSGFYSKQKEAERSKQEYVIDKAIKQYYALTGNYPKRENYLDDPEDSDSFDDKKFAADLTTKTGAVIDADAYDITYNGTPPYTAEVTIHQN